MMRIWGQISKSGRVGNVGESKYPKIIVGRRNPTPTPTLEISDSLKLIKPNRWSVADHPVEAVRKVLVAAVSESLINIIKNFPRVSSSLITVASVSQSTRVSVMKTLLYNRKCGFTYKKRFSDQDATVSFSNTFAALLIAGVYYGGGYWMVKMEPMYPIVESLEKDVGIAKEDIQAMSEELGKANDKIQQMKEQHAIEIKQLKEENSLKEKRLDKLEEEKRLEEQKRLEEPSRFTFSWFTRLFRRRE